ncbi:MAG: YraN family protein, partial [Elusimicrobiota bacterium]
MKSSFLKGKKGEEKALFFLKQKNYSIIKRNWRCRAGEIDIIAREGDTL